MNFIYLILAFVVSYAYASDVFSVSVRTKTKSNPAPVFWCRVPEGYNPVKGRAWRVLVIFGGRNCEGKAEVSGKLGWTKWADAHGVFLVAPGFKDGNYWQPQAWSGRAVFNALAEIKKSYDVDTSKVLYYGYSAGSQAANLFAAWRPDLCRAWVSHACGVFHEPSVRMKDVPGLVTCGDADAARDILSRDFVAKARAVGQPVVWKSFPNHPHDVPPGSLALARAFLAHWHETRRGELLGGDADAHDASMPLPTYIGDDPEGLYWPADSVAARAVPKEDRVELPSRAVAEAWGREGAEAARSPLPRKETVSGLWPFAIEGVPFLCRVPDVFSPTSRVVVLFGGRGWPAAKTLEAFSFDGVADEKGLFLLSPSFSKGEYWQPETGTGRMLSRAIDAVRRRFDLKPRASILYGYSAGGQCAALFSAWMKQGVVAWGAHGCGVYPDAATPPLAPALITCGVDDAERLNIGRQFAYNRREAGGMVLAKAYPGGHELDEDALRLARAFVSVFAGAAPPAPHAWGEDDTLAVRFPARIDREFRNPLFTPAIKELWQRR